MSHDAKKDPINIGVGAKDSSAELGRVGRVLAGLNELGTPEALTNRDKLSSFVTAWQHLAQQLQNARDQRQAKARVHVLMRMLITVIDGVRAMFGFLDPALSADIPIRSKVEDDDPVGFAVSIIELLNKHDGRPKQAALDLQQIVARIREELNGVKVSAASLSELEDQAKVARLNMREFEAVCERFITQNTPKTHKARSHLKPKAKQSTATATEVHGEAPAANSTATDVPAPIAAVASIKAA